MGSLAWQLFSLPFKCCGLPSPSRYCLLGSMLKTAIGPVTADEIQLCCSRYTTIFHAYFCILFCNTKVVCCSKEWAIPWVIVMFGPTLCVSPQTPGSRCSPHRAVQAQTHRGRAYPPFLSLFQMQGWCSSSGGLLNSTWWVVQVLVDVKF